MIGDGSQYDFHQTILPFSIFIQDANSMSNGSPVVLMIAWSWTVPTAWLPSTTMLSGLNSMTWQTLSRVANACPTSAMPWAVPVQGTMSLTPGT